MNLKVKLYRLKIEVTKIFFGFMYQSNVRLADDLKALNGIKLWNIRKGYKVDFNKYRLLYDNRINENILGEANDKMLDLSIVQIENGRICTNFRNSIGVFSVQNFLIPDYSFTYGRNQKGRSGHLSIEKNEFSSFTKVGKPKNIEGKVVSLLTGGGKKINFYHWFCDSISRLEIISQIYSFEEIDYFLVPSLTERYQYETFELLGIPAFKIISSLDIPHLIAKELIVTTHPRLSTFHLSNETAIFLNNTFGSGECENNKQGKVIYFSRQDATRRRILNELDLISKFRELGVEIIDPSTLTLKEMSCFLGNAAAVISAHSGALTNLIFCKHKVKVIELFTSDFILPYYGELSNALGFDYHYHVSQNKNSRLIDSRYDGQLNDITLETESVVSFVKNKLKILND